MAISKLVSGSAFDRPAISFSNKQTNYRIQKVSSMLTSKSTMDDLGSSMTKLNMQLSQMQAAAKEIVKSIENILKTIANVDREMTTRFRTLNKEIEKSRTEFTRGLAGIAPSLTGGSSATISPVAFGSIVPAASAAAVSDTPPMPPSGNSVWDAFLTWLAANQASKYLVKKVGTKLATMGVLATVPVAGWVSAAVAFAFILPDLWDLYQFWKQFRGEQGSPETEAAIRAAAAGTTATTPTPVGSPQQTAPAGAALPGAGAPQSAASPIFKAQQDQMSEAIKRGDYKTATAIASNRTEDNFPTPSSQRGAAVGMNEPETAVAPKTFGAGLGMTEPTLDVQPQRRPTDLGKTATPSTKTTIPTKLTAAPIIDPHSKSRAMFEAATEAERNGQSGTALFFAADKQRMSELAGLKKMAAQPGAPIETKKAAAVPLPPRRPTIAFGAGIGMNEPQGTFGAGLGMNEPQESSLKTDMDPAAIQARQTAEHAKGITATVEANAARDAAQKMQDVDDTDAAKAPGEKAALASDLSKREAISSGEKTAAQVRGTLRQAGERIRPNMVDNKNTSISIAGQGELSAEMADKLRQLSQESENPTSSKQSDVLQYNINQNNSSATTSGGEGNNVTGQNFPMTTNNPWLDEFIAKQAISYQ